MMWRLVAARRLNALAPDQIPSRIRLRLRLYPPRGVANQLGRVVQIELFFDLSTVRIHGLGADVELLGNGVGIFGLAEQLQHLELAIREARNRRTGAGARRGEGVQDAPRHAPTEANLAVDLLSDVSQDGLASL